MHTCHRCLTAGRLNARPMIGEDRQLLTDEPGEFEKQPVEFQDNDQGEPAISYE